MRTVKKTFGLEILLKLAKAKLPERNGEYRLIGEKRIYRKCENAVRKYNLHFRVG